MNEENNTNPGDRYVAPAPVTPLPEQPVTKRKDSGLRDTLSTIGVIILAPLVALFLITFVFQSYQVDGPSMETTLQNGDRLIVTKTGKTWSKITRKDYVPKRYEVIIFNHSGEFANTSGRVTEKQLIKRVIGVPGDRVVVKDGIVTVYNDEHPNGFQIDREEPAGKTVGKNPENENVDETVKDGEVYVMGDNRTNSLDSRAFGTVRSQDIVGRLSLRIFPFNKFETY